MFGTELFVYNTFEEVFNRTTVISDCAFGVLSLVFWIKQCFVEKTNLMFSFFLSSCPKLSRIVSLLTGPFWAMNVHRPRWWIR